MIDKEKIALDKEMVALELIKNVKYIVDEDIEVLIKSKTGNHNVLVFDEIKESVYEIKEMLNKLDYESLLNLPLF
jgi:hypothetical protein